MGTILSTLEHKQILASVDGALCQIEWDASNRHMDDNKEDQFAAIKELKITYEILTGKEWICKNIRIPE